MAASIVRIPRGRFNPSCRDGEAGHRLLYRQAFGFLSLGANLARTRRRLRQVREGMRLRIHDHGLEAILRRAKEQARA
ncbi:MAG: hypothetical protein O7H41_03440 [Planctomycetota bacterium]|nr:hypothetical protein [Planctomycetota bacterium]